MSVCIALRDDYDSIELRCLAKHSAIPAKFAGFWPWRRFTTA